MTILLICSKHFYDRIPPVAATVRAAGHTVLLPNCYDAPMTEARMAAAGAEAHRAFKAAMFRRSAETIAGADAVLVLNYDKETEGGTLPRYIGGATFLEMYDAFRMGKRIYLLNPPPDGILADEIQGFGPQVLNGDLAAI